MLNERYSKIFVTGFGPFGRIAENPSGQLAANCGAPFEILDVAYGAVDRFIASFDDKSFDVLLMMGVADGRDRLCAEFFARNFASKSPDVEGEVRFGDINPTAQVLLPSTLWVPRTVAGWTTELPVRPSYDAGDYLCNYLSFKAYDKFYSKQVGFLHVPAQHTMPLEVQSEILSMILDDIAAA